MEEPRRREPGRIEESRRELTPQEREEIARDIAEEVRQARIQRKLDKVSRRAAEAADRARAAAAREQAAQARAQDPRWQAIEAMRAEAAQLRRTRLTLENDNTRLHKAGQTRDRARWS